MFNNTVRNFLDHFGLGSSRATLPYLKAITKAFSSLPYENATKIIKKKASLENNLSPLRWPDEVFGDYLKYGAGGTCFSLCYFLLHILRYCGFAAEIEMANRSYGDNTHCAVVCHLDGSVYLLDPGFLLYKPLLLRPQGYFQESYFLGALIFESLPNALLQVSTLSKGILKKRYDLKRWSVNDEAFVDYWLASFDFKGLNEIVVTTGLNDQQMYLRGTYFSHETALTKQSRHVDGMQIEKILQTIGMNHQLILKAQESKPLK